MTFVSPEELKMPKDVIHDLKRIILELKKLIT